MATPLSKDEIAKARQMDLLTYLSQMEPSELVHLSHNQYSTRTHDSLKISNGKWMWWSRNIGGKSALDYLVKVKGLDFLTSVKQVLQCSAYSPADSIVKTAPANLMLPDKDSSNDLVIEYMRSRAISSTVIHRLINERVIYQSLEKHKGRQYRNLIVLGFDEEKQAKYALCRGLTKTRFIGDLPGSNKAYSYFRPSETNTNTVHVFEGFFDAISYVSMELADLKNRSNAHILSLGGVYKSINGKPGSFAALDRCLSLNPNITDIILHFDNDETGRGAVDNAVARYWHRNIIDMPPPYGNDFNDYWRAIHGGLVGIA
ncbi:toprim domain-containing protein [Eubacteriales bacterium OttesenSCG-928-N14]|nr:toprim domain-containing protein [Eubacteriales bacterium OttesenSCG-928-N14]